MLYILYCRDDPAVSRETRATYRHEHLAYLEQYADWIVLGGAMLAEDGQTRVGSALVLNVESLAQAEAFSANEPFRKAGLYKEVSITRMRRAQWHPCNAPQTAEGCDANARVS